MTENAVYVRAEGKAEEGDTECAKGNAGYIARGRLSVSLHVIWSLYVIERTRR